MKETVDLTRRDFLIGTGKLGMLALMPAAPRFAIAGPLETDPAARMEAVSRRCGILLKQLDRGLPYLGQARNFVPRRDPRVQQTTLTTLQSNLNMVSQRAAAAAAAGDAAAATMADLQQGLVDISAKINEREQTYKKELDSWKGLNDELASLDADVRAQRTALQAAEIEFQNAVRANTSPGCSFGAIVAAVGAIAAVVSGAEALIPAIAGVADGIANTDLSPKSIKEIVKRVEVVHGDVNSIADGYNRIRHLLDADSKGALLVLDEKALNEHVQDAIDGVNRTEGASESDKQQMVAAIRSYVAACQARNTALLAMDTAAASANAALVDSANLAAQQSKLLDGLNNGQLVSTRSLAASLTALQRHMMRDLRDYLWVVERATDYYQLREYVARTELSTDDPAQLVAAISTSTQALSTYLDWLPGNAPDIPPAGGALFTIQVDLTDEQGKALDNGEPILLIIRPELHTPAIYAKARCFFAQKVTVAVDGRSVFQGTLLHLGKNRFVTLDGRRRDFITSPDPRWVTQNEIDLGAGVGYLGVSPFSDWQLQIDKRRFAWSHPAFVTLTFSGKSRPGGVL